MASKKKPDKLTRFLGEEKEQGAFSRVLTKSGQLLDGDALDQWLAPLRKEHYTNEDFARTVYYQSAHDLTATMAPGRGAKGTFSPLEMSFVYLDVGAWVGSAEGAWGKADKSAKTGRYIKRDFGIVCGPLVCLCTFSYAWGQGDCKAWKEADKSAEPYKSVAALLDVLSNDNEFKSDLGKALVRDLAVAAPANPLWPADPKDYLLHVVVGDLHIPVLSEKIQTYGGTARVEEGGAKVTIPDRVPRWGRLDLAPLESLITSLVGQSEADGTAFLEKLCAEVEQGEGYGHIATHDGSPVAKKVLAGKKGDWQGLRDDDMSSDEAARWYEFYKVGVDGGKPADIAEGAAMHFMHFVDRLGAYALQRAGDPDMLPAKLLQLGDMLDLWVGFTCHYRPSPDPDQPLLSIDPIGQQMVQHWVRNLFGHTEQGKAAAVAIDLAKARGLDPVWLYGNHDNYLGSWVQVSYKNPVGTDRALDPRQPYYQAQGVLMEHGHQWEASNADSAAPIPVISDGTIGTPSPMGLFVTQASFIRPAPVRNFEGVAAGVMAKISGTYGQRMDQIVGAANRFVSMSGGFYVYVMGHTHSAALSRVVVVSRKGDEVERARRKLEDSPEVSVFFTQAGAGFDGVHYVHPGYTPASVDVSWTQMNGFGEREWVSVGDGLGFPRNVFDDTVKGMAAPSDKPSGQHTFKGVPPGLYKARYYLLREGMAPFRVSANAVAVEGISIEGDADDTEGVTFEYDDKKKKFTHRIFLRWAYAPARFDTAQAGFVLARAGDPVGHAGELPARPERNFARLGSRGIAAYEAGTNCGRCRLDVEIDLPWSPAHPHDGPFGHWEVRAYLDAARTRPAGVAKFEVVHAGEMKKTSAHAGMKHR